jgi:Family of unknown function (DUF6221)
MNVSDIVGFLNARLDEVEATATRRRPGPGRARMLREVEAKRLIIASQSRPYMKHHVPPTEVLRCLAGIDRDHPDYDPDWSLPSAQAGR